jgi:SOUL heme-binding protein
MLKRISLLLFLLNVPGFAAMADSIEEPKYELLDTLDALSTVELRLYEPSIQATTALRNHNQTTSGFRRLASYIFGENDGRQTIAMTAPVQETLTPDEPIMAFTMPSGSSMESLPNPDSEQVVLREVPERLVASLSFGGWATEGRVESKTASLMETLAIYNATVEGPPILNQYNPPWTLPFMRRNEITVEVSFGSME